MHYFKLFICVDPLNPQNRPVRRGPVAIYDSHFTDEDTRAWLPRAQGLSAEKWYSQVLESSVCSSPD